MLEAPCPGGRDSMRLARSSMSFMPSGARFSMTAHIKRISYSVMGRWRDRPAPTMVRLCSCVEPRSRFTSLPSCSLWQGGQPLRVVGALVLPSTPKSTALNRDSLYKASVSGPSTAWRSTSAPDCIGLACPIQRSPPRRPKSRTTPSFPTDGTPA